MESDPKLLSFRQNDSGTTKLGKKNKKELVYVDLGCAYQDDMWNLMRAGQRFWESEFNGHMSWCFLLTYCGAPCAGAGRPQEGIAQHWAKRNVRWFID